MERRSTFRFRLPWSQSESESATKPSTQPSTGPNRTRTRQATRSRTTSKPSSSTKPATSGKPSSPAQPSAGTQGRNEAPASTTTPPPRSPQPQPQNSAETKASSQPTTSTNALPETSPIPPQPSAERKAHVQFTINPSPLPESSPVLPQSSSETKTPIQSSTTNTKPTNAPASPKSETQTPTTTITTVPTSTISQSPQSNPPGVAPSGTESLPLIPSREQQSITSQPASPSDVAPKSNASQPPSPSPSPQKQSKESSETSSKSAEAKNWSPEKVMQPSELSGVRSTSGITEGPSKISDSSRIISEPKKARPLETNNQETKVKEVVQETKDKNHAAGEETGGPLTSKEQPGVVFQSKQAQPSSDDDQIRVNRVSNGKQTRTISSQLKNKIVVSGRKENAGSAEQDIPLNKEVKDNISKFIHRMAVGDGKQNLEEGPVSVITLAGDNRGASMQLGSNSSRKGKAMQIHRGYKLNSDESADATTDAEGSSEGRQPNDARTMKDQEIEAYMNCNVQGLNNSITLDSFIEGKNPGIHMSIPRMNSEPVKSSERTGLFEAHKAEFNVTRAQKHTYEPTIRRRCLDGLYFEPSDSDSDNPEKPRGHGCQVGGMKKRDNEIDIL